ncbi:MAG: hypothetical protein JNJ57_04150, partial [Saprospiraceae bacterium]|nr:hypothetical protein [Saprospiraceae bacterium]
MQPLAGFSDMTKWLIIIFFCLPALLTAHADTISFTQAQDNLLQASSRFQYQPIDLYAHHFPAANALPASGWTTRSNRDLSFPSNTKAVCLRFWVKNASTIQQSLVLEIDDLQLDRAKLWAVHANGVIDSSHLMGDKLPFHQRDLAFANPNFLFHMAAGETAQIIIYLDQSGLFLGPRLNLWPEKDFAVYAGRRQLKAGMIIGIFCLSLLAFTLASLFSLSPVAKWYTGFVAIQTIQIVMQLGIGHQYLWPESGFWSTFLAVVLPLLGFTLLFRLLDHLLEVPARLPTWHTTIQLTFKTLLGFAIIAYAIAQTGWNKPLLFFYPLVMIMAIGLCLMVITTCFKTWQLFHEQKSLLFLAAFICGIAGAVLSWLTKLGFSINFEAGRYGVVVGFIFDLLLFNYIIFRDLWQTKTKNHSLQIELLKSAKAASENLLNGQEMERKRLSMDLHDGVGIELGSIRRRLEKLLTSDPNPDYIAETSKAVTEISNVAEQIRKFSHALDPFSAKNLTLPDLLDNLLLDFETA